MTEHPNSSSAAECIKLSLSRVMLELFLLNILNINHRKMTAKLVLLLETPVNCTMHYIQHKLGNTQSTSREYL